MEIDVTLTPNEHLTLFGGLGYLDAEFDSFDAAFDEWGSEPSSEEIEGLFGGFPEIMERYGLMRDGVLIAPRLTLRSLYKARWNAIHRQALTDGERAHPVGRRQSRPRNLT